MKHCRARRRTTIAAAVLATTSVAAGCGSSNDDLQDRSGDSGSSAADKALDEDSLVPTLTKAMNAKRSAHVTLALTGDDGTIKGSGDVTHAGRRRSLQATYSGKDVGGRLTLRNVDGTIFLRLEGQMPEGKFLQPDPAKAEDASVIKQMGQLSDYIDPVQVVDQLDGAVQDVEDKGSATVDGVRTTDYAVEVDTAAVFQRLSLNTLSEKDLEGAPKKFTLHVYVDGAGLLHKMTVKVPGFDYTFGAAKWGKPVRLAKPAAGDILPAS